MDPRIKSSLCTPFGEVLSWYLLIACGPGKYKGKESTTNVYCYPGERDACLLCPGETIKPNTGDSDSCPEDCGGGSKVANAEHTACGKLEFIAIWGSSDEENEYREIMEIIIKMIWFKIDEIGQLNLHIKKFYSEYHLVCSTTDLEI